MGDILRKKPYFISKKIASFFGEPFNCGKNIFFDSYMLQRGRLGLKDYFEFDLLPQIKDI